MDKFQTAKQELTFEHNVETALCHADPVHVRMILENILSNANKYTPDKGVITMTLKNTPTRIKVTVKDSGVGISRHDIPKLFQKFSRINNSLTTTAGGSGLGLYWVKKLVALHGATISVHSKLGQGSTFTVTFMKST